MDFITIYFYFVVFLFGICVGSFLNVLIYRIPKGEDFVVTPSHCMNCGKRLKFYELVPIFSYIFLRGKCSKCKSRVSVQYPLIEGINGLLWVLIYYNFGFSLEALFVSLLTSALLALSIIDEKTKEIPPVFTIFIGILSAVRLFFNLSNWLNLLLGAVCVSLFLLILLLISNGRAIGGGDVKLMAGCGLFLGLESTVLAFFIGCIIGSIVHLIRMRFFGKDRELALGPYLSIGVFLCAIWGESIVNWYLHSLLGI